MHKNCRICKANHATLYWNKHKDGIKIYCCKCGKLYTLKEYSLLSNIPEKDLLSEISDEVFEENKDASIKEVILPPYLISLFNPASKEGRDYLNKRKINIYPDLLYDSKRNGIAQLLYKGDIVVGCQIRLIDVKENQPKMISLKGTKKSISFFGWNGDFSNLIDVDVIFVTEGAFDSLSIKSVFKTNKKIKAIATLGCKVSKTQIEMLKQMKERNIKIICAFDGDEAGIEGRELLIKEKAIDYYIDNEGLIDWNDMLVKYDENYVLNILRERCRYGV